MLPSASEVWGKAIFSQVFVCPHGVVSVSCHSLSGFLVPCSFYGSLCPWFHVPFTGGLCQGFLCPGGLCPAGSLSGGLCLGGGSLSGGSLCGGGLCRETPPPPNRIRKVGGIHSTRMLSCCRKIFGCTVNFLRRSVSTVRNFPGKIIWTLFQVLHHNLRNIYNVVVKK